MRGRMQMWELMNGSTKDLQKLLQLRDNCAFYCDVLDHYAPAVVGKRWNDDANMKAFCTTTDTKAFGRHVLLVSDEAFIILVLVNASPRWMAEIICAENMVRYRVRHATVGQQQLLLLTQCPCFSGTCKRYVVCRRRSKHAGRSVWTTCCVPAWFGTVSHLLRSW